MEEGTLADISYTCMNTVGSGPIDEDEVVNYSTDNNMDAFINDLNEKDKQDENTIPQVVEQAINFELNVPSADTINRINGEHVTPNGEHVFKIPRPVGRPKSDPDSPKKSVEKSWECPICGKQFKHLKDMKRHEQRHSGVKLFGCDICSKRFTRNEYLKTHLKRHMGILDFPCNLCDRAFPQQKELNTHLATHKESETATCTYYCQFCSMKFMILGMLKDHLKRVHGGMSHPWVCNLCPQTYRLVKELKRHMKEDHDDPLSM